MATVAPGLQKFLCDRSSNALTAAGDERDLVLKHGGSISISRNIAGQKSGECAPPS